MTLSLEQLNAANRPGFVALLDGVYEHSPWIAEAAHAGAPFRSLPHLKWELARVVREAGPERQKALICAHPELAGKAAIAGELTIESSQEQSSAGLTHCTPEEFARLQQLNADYKTRFGWPFILAVRGPRGTGLSRTAIIDTFARRLDNPVDFELAECLRQIHRIAEIRLNDKFDVEPTDGNLVWDWAETLAAHSESGDESPGQLTVTYLSKAHQRCARQLADWMKEAGCDEVRIDAVGNVVGVYHGRDRQAPRLLTGSHYDTVRNGGKYDGRLGIFVPLAGIRRLARQGRRLAFGIEIVGFAEEEGQRFDATFLGSSTLCGTFDPNWLDQLDAHGVSMRQAMADAGLSADPATIALEKRDASRYLGFVEVHIEQGPWLDEIDQPLGVVTAINGSARYTGEIIGQASHAGTTPMDRRRDAAAAVAELVLYVEQRARQDLASPRGPSVGTVGVLQVPAGSINVVPGRCQFTLDLRAPDNAQRDALSADVERALQAICERRGLRHQLKRTLLASAAPADPVWLARWSEAVAKLGLPVFKLPSGAGHDAMKLHEILPQAMLFVRGGNAGISHNPLESVTSDDAQLCVDAFLNLLEAL